MTAEELDRFQDAAEKLEWKECLRLVAEVRRLQMQVAELERDDTCVDCGSRDWRCRICRQRRDWAGGPVEAEW